MIEIPVGLEKRGRQLWRDVTAVAGARLGPPDLLLLAEACRTADRLERLDGVIRAKGNEWIPLAAELADAPVAVVVEAIPPIRVHTGETFPLLRFLVGDFRDRDPRCAGDGSYTVYANRLEVITTGGEAIDLTLEVMVRAGLLVHGPAFTPFCPAEADYTGDAELDLARSGRRWPEPLFSAVFPASPAMLEIWGIPNPPIPPAMASVALRGLGLTLIFPGGHAFVAAPGWSDTFHQWQRFVPAAGGAGSPSPRELGHQMFVPDDINHLKTVRARITEAPSRP